MQNTETDERTALLKAADIPNPSPSLVDRIARMVARQSPKTRVATLAGRVHGQPIDPRTFELSGEGSGAFGQWTLDAEKLPAYRYDMNQRRDVRAYYTDSEGRVKRDHWHQVGNDRVTALALNDGAVQVYLADRGGVFLNRSEAGSADPPASLVGYIDALLRLIIQIYGALRSRWVRFRSRGVITPRIIAVKPPVAEKIDREDVSADFAFSGGFGYLNDGQDTWATAFRYGPPEAETRRVFGTGYYETEMIYHDIRQTRWVYAPYGRDPVVLADVEIENRRKTAVDVRYYEYWDINVHQLQIEWLRTGLAAPLGDSKRSGINAHFVPQMMVQSDPQALRFHQEFRPGALLDGIERREIDTSPADVFLANLNPTPAASYVDKAAFFGEGGVRQPDAIRKRLAGAAEIPALDGAMPYCAVLRHDLHLEPGETIRLRYAFGAARPGEPLALLKPYSSGDWLKQTLQAWKSQLPYFSTGGDPVLQRETTWHAYNVLSATLYSEYFNVHYTPQGSAYLYLHGAEGVPRDQSLFTIPMVYIRPGLARQTLSLLMSLRDEVTLALPYGFVGDGAVVKNTLGFHAYPSDLDLFILLAISEYLAATGDMDFLNAQLPLYRFDGRTNPIAPITVLEHIRAAVKHLQDIGFGPHRLLKIGDGDWDDSIVMANVYDPRNSIKSGESVPNSQMALHVLPLAASILEKHAPDIAAQLCEMAQVLKEAVKKQWDAEKSWFHRAYLRDVLDNEVIIGDHHFSLQSQIWPIISGLSAEMKIEPQLIETIRTNVDDPSPTGAMLEVKGQVWPAVSQLLTWAYRRTRPDLAWRSLNRHTFAAHALVFPNIWHNIWSGPDATNGKGMSGAGGTWINPATPMTDFPLMNANQDAMALTALLRVCGIEPSMKGDGLDITPKPPPERFVLDTQLLRLDVEPGRVAGEYRAVANGSRILHILLPDQAVEVTATVDDRPLPEVQASAARVDIQLDFAVGQKIRFEVRWRPLS